MNTNFTLSEKHLIEDCINGNRKSQQHLYKLYAARMYALCFRYAKRQMDAEDILQEGFVKVFNNLHKFRGEGSFDGWVRRIFVNTSIEHIRKNHIDIVSEEGFEDKFIDTQITALDNLYKQDLLTTARKLSLGYRTVFTLYAVDGYSHKEIASQLGISESTSKSQFSRAKALLRNLLTQKTETIPAGIA